WSGQVLEPHDGLHFIGKNPGDSHIYIVTGDSGQGFTSSAIAGMMIPDLIEGRGHRWENLYSPSRLPTHALAAMLAETARMVSAYREWVTPHPREKVADLRPGCGVVARVGGKLHAFYMDEHGSVSEHSAVCPHLYGIVRWNASEHTWD